MKTLITIAITLLITIPLAGYAVGGMIQYQTLDLDKMDSTATKFYDHDEGIICYVIDGFYSGGISCLKD